MKPGTYTLGTSIHKSPTLSQPFLSKEIRKQDTECEVRKALLERLRQGTAPDTTSIPTQITIAGLKRLLSAFKSNIDLAKSIAGGRKATMPALFNTKITKVLIPIMNNLLVEGFELVGEGGSFSCEWVEYTGPAVDDDELSPDIVEREPERVKSMDLPSPLSPLVYNPKRPFQRVVLYLHGGAYLVASRRTHRGITSRIAKQADALVFVIDYRLAPQHVFPSFLIDGLSAYQFLLQQYHAHQISFVGDSAGAGLAIAMANYCQNTKQFPMPGSVVCMSPYVTFFDIVRHDTIVALLVHERIILLPTSRDSRQKLCDGYKEKFSSEA